MSYTETFEEIEVPVVVNGERKTVTKEKDEKFGLGWLPDLPDFRDYEFAHDEIKKVFHKTKLTSSKPTALPPAVDLRPWCSPIENQGSLGSCTAHAGVGLLEYFERRAYGTYINASRLFLYKTTRNYIQMTGDTGAYLRNTMGAMVLFGLPPEKYWQYDIAKFDIEPSAFLYSFADSYKALKYYRLDSTGVSGATLLNTIKTNLASGLPSMFGFTVFNSFYQAATTGKIPFPSTVGDPIVGGHAVVVVGYNDSIKIKNSLPGSTETVGALLIRNSWGTWGGMGGYLWMPYNFVLKGIACDFWSLISAGYISTGNFDI